LLLPWGASTLLVGSVLRAGHWVVLPVPDRADVRLERAIGELDSLHAAGGWQMLHVLYTECRCSQRIFEYLLAREHPSDVRETILLVGAGEGWAARARAGGYAILTQSAQQLAERFGIEAAPLLVVVDPGRRVRYAGGYTERPQGLDYRDLSILQSLRSRGGAAELPAFGCAVSRELQSYLDPIGIKYRP
jgi:hypothetical protein